MAAVVSTLNILWNKCQPRPIGAGSVRQAAEFHQLFAKARPGNKIGQWQNQSGRPIGSAVMIYEPTYGNLHHWAYSAKCREAFKNMSAADRCACSPLHQAEMVRARGLEPPILTEPDPKSGVSAIPPRARYLNLSLFSLLI